MALYNVVFSPTGGTSRVLDIISKELFKEALTVDLTKNSDFSEFQIQNEDLVLIAMPSFGGRAPQVAIDRLKKLKGEGAKAVVICVYGNRAYEDTLVEMFDVAKESGFNVIAGISAIAEHSIARQFATGRPDDKDEAMLKVFAAEIKKRFSSSDLTTPEISGNKPYKKGGNAGVVPKTLKSCKNCKKCAEICPTGAISRDDACKIDKNKCISCMRCVSSCPSKEISKIIKMLVSFALKKVCTERKENELF